MNTPIQILEKIVARLEKRNTDSEVDDYADDMEDLVKKGREYFQDIEYTIDMLQTIIDLEKGKPGGGIMMG